MRRVQGKDVAKKGRNTIFSSRPVHKFLKRSSHLQQLRFKNTLGSRNPELSIKLSENIKSKTQKKLDIKKLFKMNLKDSPALPLPLKTRSKVSKFKIIRLNGGTQYIGRLNKSLSVKEIASTISALENPSILPTSDVVMLPIRESQITPKDQFMKHFYNNTRNLKKLNRSVPKKIPQSSKCV
ncbi:unnamed protein product [Moneuplotes crassus]|uniref:Uncharacterized protein n=1 Tax=Euplotes crassus TaxID=5936 RepID=A0AAD1XG28_EUPCR|nr:unnamed protein product [Moneuplotes crassus]